MGGRLGLKYRRWLCTGLTTLWRTRVNRRQGRDMGGRLRLKGTRWLSRRFTTPLHARVNWREGRDMGRWLRLKGWQCLWLSGGLITLRCDYKIHTSGWWLGHWLWLWL